MKKYHAVVWRSEKVLERQIYITDGATKEDALDVLRTSFSNRKYFKYVCKHCAFNWYNFTYERYGNEIEVSVEFLPLKEVKKGIGSNIKLKI